jgi:hypothetical protein
MLTMFADTKLRDIRKWLAPPDPSTNHMRACKKHHKQTGGWFVHGAEFSPWKKEQDSMLWLHGIPGCGK